MKQQLLSGIATAALTTVMGTTLLVGSSSRPIIASNANPEVNSVESQPQATPTFSPSQTLSNSQSQEKPIAHVYPHKWQGRLAATLRVRDIPVLTFLEPKTPNQGKSNNSPPKDPPTPNNTQAQTDPVQKAQSVADRLNQLYQDQIDANQITLARNPQTKSYEIKVKDEVLVSFNETIILPDTTKKKNLDALQATNRLRRLMGDADPLTAIEETIRPNSRQNDPLRVKPYKRGIASWYGPGFHGRRTANGERYNQNGLTAAHRYLPFGTKVRVTNLSNGRSVIVRINDRGPYSGGRIIDLSAGAARTIGLFWSGVAPVSLELLE